MRNVMRLLVLLVTVIGCARLAAGDPINNPPSGGGDTPCETCECQLDMEGGAGPSDSFPGGAVGADTPCASGSCPAPGGAQITPFGAGAAEAGSLSVTLNLGCPAFPGALSGGSLRLYAQAPSAQLATPEALSCTFGTRILFVSTDQTAGGAPREVTLESRNGRQIKFRFGDGSAWAYPQAMFRGEPQRLFMVDSNGVAVTQNPAWYDLAYGNGNSDRFAAQPDASGIRPLEAVYATGGRRLTLANSGLEVIRDTANALRQIKTASALADIVTETGRRYRIDFYAVPTCRRTATCTFPSGLLK